MKTVAQLLKLKDLQNQQVHTIGPDQMVLDALMVLKGRSSVGTPVRDIMSSKVITVDSQRSVEACMGIMTDSHLRHLPVVEGGQLLGLLSIGDLVKEAIAEQASLIRQLEQYIRGE
ncbi:CBS domain-containing protein [Pseudomonas syringae pv. syringae]|uniref:CBS domain-containing protein n=1 Tax=Pseudomonas syringae TaxID=317 RepID=UPI00200ACC24|nr:CBS domain-containing protein [Pseudomonas syringae]MCK9742407.1 CBS domain-containing protein [Pseudomonas syringae pv. syringae]